MAQDFLAPPGSLPILWGRRGVWQIKLRWVVAPLMVLGVVVARGIGFEFPTVPILLIGAATIVYNAAFAWVFIYFGDRLRNEPKLDRLLTILQVVADYVAMFLLLHFSGGVASPLSVFLIFHVIIAAVQFRPGVAYLFAAWAAGGLWILLLGDLAGWLPSTTISLRGEPFLRVDRPAYEIVALLFFTAALFITASMITPIMRRLRNGFGDLARTGSELAQANHKLNGLYQMVRTIGAEREVDPILSTITSEIARVLNVSAVAVKLLADDEETLRYVAVYGLPAGFIDDKVIELDRSPLNRRIVAGDTLVHGHFEGSETFQLQSELRAMGFKSAALSPLKVEDRVIGTLGVYSRTDDRFGEGDANFLRLAGELAAIGIEDARANEAIERLMRERTEFMLEVAHNLRAPLGASLSMLELLREKYLGEINERQDGYLSRIEVRLRALHRLIGELLTIGRTRDWSREIPDVVVDLHQLADHTRKTFDDEAAEKKLDFKVICEDGMPGIDSGADLLEQVLENLVSNAIKYTPEDGEVEVSFARRGDDQVRIVVRDSGIGIPAAEQDRLFCEFFRASNAKRHTRDGTGLGLALVKQTVERHNGQLRLASEEDEGTTVVIDLPIRQPRKP